MSANFGMPGNPIIDGMLVGQSMPVSEAHYLADLAVAAEQRTANLIAWHAYLSRPEVGRPGEAAVLEKEINSRLGLPS